MKKTLGCLFVSFALTATGAIAVPTDNANAAQTAVPSACAQHYDVVIGVGDKDKVEAALRNAKNLQNATGAACTNVEIVNYSSAVTLLSPMSPKAPLIKESLQQGIHIVACENSLEKFKLTGDDLFPGITTVPSGVAEIVKRQKEGYLYFTP